MDWVQQKLGGGHDNATEAAPPPPPPSKYSEANGFDDGGPDTSESRIFLDLRDRSDENAAGDVEEDELDKGKLAMQIGGGL